MADPTPPFGASVDGVQGLVPEARLLEQPPASPTSRGVTRGQVEGWLEELTGVVELRLDGWRGLRAEASPEEVAAGVDAPRVRLVRWARAAIQTAAASYVEAARFPERASKADTSYAEVLWRRYESLIADLATWLTDALEDGTPGGDVTGTGGAAGSFPPASFTPDTLRW